MELFSLQETRKSTSSHGRPVLAVISPPTVQRITKLRQQRGRVLQDQSSAEDGGDDRQQQGFLKKQCITQQGSNKSQRNSLVRYNSNNSIRSNDELSRKNSMLGNTSDLQEKNNPAAKSLSFAAKKKDDIQDSGTRRESWFQQGHQSPWAGQAGVSALEPDDDSITVVAVRTADEVSAATRRPRLRSTQEPSTASASRFFGATPVPTAPTNNRPLENRITSTHHATEPPAFTTPVPAHIRLLAGTMVATYRQKYRSSDVTQNYNQMTPPPARTPIIGRPQLGAMSDYHMSPNVAHSPDGSTPPYIPSPQRSSLRSTSAWYSSSGTVRDRWETLTSGPRAQSGGSTINDSSVKCSHCSKIFSNQQTLKTHMQHHTGTVNFKKL